MIELENQAHTVLEVSHLKIYFKTVLKNNIFTKIIKDLKAVDDISFTLKAGETLGVVGESGCGKSTLGRAILRLVEQTSGDVIYNKINISKSSDRELRNFRKDLQIIFQDPLASLNPRMTIGQIIAEPLKNFYPKLSNREVMSQVSQTMTEVGLLPEHINRYPHEFSGGQCQRIGIARALILKPKVIICDEPVSALDVSIQAQIINLLKSLQKKYGLSLIFIAHDLSIVQHISNRIMVMYLGKIVEIASADDIYFNPKHPYTKALLSAIPIPDPKQEQEKLSAYNKLSFLNGELPSPLDPPSGCKFRTRCPIASENCIKIEPKLKTQKNDKIESMVACHKA